MNEQEFLTEEKKIELENELQDRKVEKRQLILDRLAFAKSLGDLSENAEYHSSKDDQGKNEARISQIEAVLKNAIIVEANTDGTVGLGSIVDILHLEKDILKTYQVVGKEEADFSAGKISFDSPLGSALMDNKSGYEIFVETPKGNVKYKIIEVK